MSIGSVRAQERAHEKNRVVDRIATPLESCLTRGNCGRGCWPRPCSGWQPAKAFNYGKCAFRWSGATAILQPFTRPALGFAGERVPVPRRQRQNQDDERGPGLSQARVSFLEAAAAGDPVRG